MIQRRDTRRTLLPQGSVALLLVGSAIAALPSASGCKGKSEPVACDVYKVFETSCDGVGCHGSEGPQANLDLVSPGIDQRLFHQPGTGACDERKLVFPGRPEDSLLYLKVTDSDPFCGRKMPINGSLSSDEISCIRSYIENAGKDTQVQDCETCGGILCVDFERDPDHCGGCGQTCAAGEVCGGGDCIEACQDGLAQCGSSCVDLDTNNQHCGTCGHRCGPGSSCQAGVCACDLTSTGAGGAGGMSSVDQVPSFQSDILPILENSCSGAECHTEMDRVAPLGLEPSEAYSNLVGAPAEECGGRDYVVPDSPDQSYLVEKLMGGTVCSGERMPLGDDPLPTAGVHTIVNWICAGAPDN